MPDVRLRKEERLTSRKQLAAVFAEGRSFLVFPIRFVWIIVPKDGVYPVRAAFSVSRRRWKNATDRNFLKRRMREAYRVQKDILYHAELPADQQILLTVIYTSPTTITFDKMYAAMTKGLKRLAGQLSQLG